MKKSKKSHDTCAIWQRFLPIPIVCKITENSVEESGKVSKSFVFKTKNEIFVKGSDTKSMK